MHIAVLGAGVVGMTTAYYLLEAGHEVTVIDRATDVAQCCSYGNGAQLSYSYVDAMGSPSFLARIPGLLAGAERAIRFRPPPRMDILRWGTKFLAQCTRQNAAANTLANLELAVRSRDLLTELRGEVPGNFHHQGAGKLVLLAEPRDVDNARKTSRLKSGMGCTANVVSIDEAVGIEPAVAHLARDYAGAIWSPGDDVGDARLFTSNLAEYLRKRSGFRLALGEKARGIVVRNGRCCAVSTDSGSMDADAAVVCLGASSPAILKPLGIDIPVYPARGYSVTLPPGPHAASVSITDFSSRFVISRLGGKVRIAGFADFVGFNTSRDARRVQDLLDVARSKAPDAADYESLSQHAWGGFRPLTPNGRPIIGATGINGLYLNTGHGSLGWTLACASGEKVASEISGGGVAAIAA